MIELLIFALLGIALGAVAGLVPGLHVNTIALIMLGLVGFIEPLPLAVLVISMTISATFFDFIPSTLLGAPDPETALSMLPGHRMLSEGRGIEAIYLTMLGGLCAVLLAFFSMPLMILVIPLLYAFVQGYIVWILAAMVGLSIIMERSLRKGAWAAAIILLSGAIGVIALGSFGFRDPLFPMFTGLFAISTLVFSLGNAGKIPEQKQRPTPPKKGVLLSGVFKGLFSGSLVGTLPAMGAAQATLLTQQMSRKGGDEEYLVSMGTINTAVALFSMVSLYTIAKARSGSAVVIGRLIPGFGVPELVLLMAASLIAAGVSALVIMRVARWSVKSLAGLDYRKASLSVIAFLVILVAILTGVPGLLLLGVSSMVGILAPLSGARRSNAMGALIIPLIVFYAGF